MFAKFGYTYGTDLNDDLTGTAGVDEINGLAGNDSIYGGAGNDTLDGGTGNDNIFGENGDDILIGGEGNDYLIGGNGADTYIFNPGFGNDAIDNSDDNASANEPDIIQFGEGILASKQLWDVKGTTLSSQFHTILMKMVLLVRMILSGYTVILTSREHPAQLLILLFLLMEQLGIMNMFVIIGTAFPMRMAEKPLRETMKTIQSTAQITTTSL